MPICNEEGCKVNVDGLCINGLDIASCPHYSENDDVTDEFDGLQDNEMSEVEPEDESVASLKVNGDLIDVNFGKSLTAMQANSVAASSLTRLLVLAGMPDSGKTTLILSLMHLFQTKPSFEGYQFAGSNTLLDFEEKSHSSKTASDRKEPETPRTPFGPPVFLHLKVVESNQTDPTVDLLFTDISGELFKDLVDFSKDAKEFVLARRADHFLLFFDSNRITSYSERASAKAFGLGILRSLMEAGVLLQHTHVQVIFSRWDLYIGKGNQQEHDEFISTIKDDINKQFGDRYNIEFFEVSARSKNAVLPFGYGLDKLFPVWVKKSLLDANESSHATNRIVNNKHFFRYQFNQ